MAKASRRPDGTSIVLASFTRPDAARRALEDLLVAGFQNVEQEVEGGRTDVIVEPDGRESEAAAILERHGGVRVKLAG